MRLFRLFRHSSTGRGRLARALGVALPCFLAIALTAAPGAQPSPSDAGVQMPLVPGTAADPSITTHDGRYYLTYNKEGFADSIVMRVASSLDGLYHAHDHVIWQGRQGPPEVRARVGLGSWLLPWNGRWYLYGWGDDGSSVTTSRPFVLESEGLGPAGPVQLQEDVLVTVG